MPRCDVHLCGDPITPGTTGFICVVCDKAFCSHHSGPGCMELSCCENDQRQCGFCGKVTTAIDGIHLGDMFKCVFCVDAGRVELHLPQVPLVENELQDLVA